MHMKQKHDINIIRCNKCEYIAKDKSDLQNHVRDHMSIKKTISCGHCNFTASRDSDLTDHINTKHQFSEVYNKACRYYRQGRCNRPSTCKFKHEGVITKSNQIKPGKTPRCTRGEGCSLKKKNRCHYFHDDVGVQLQRESQPNNSSEDTQEKRTQRLWCKIQETCKKGPNNCPFRHYDQEFPKLPAKKVGSMAR